MPAILWMAKDLPDFEKYFTGQRWLGIYGGGGAIAGADAAPLGCTGEGEHVIILRTAESDVGVVGWIEMPG